VCVFHASHDELGMVKFHTLWSIALSILFAVPFHMNG